MKDLQATVSRAKAGEPMLFKSLDGRHVLHVDYPMVSVYDGTRPSPHALAGTLVAHSCMRADFEASLEEFLRDYVGPLGD